MSVLYMNPHWSQYQSGVSQTTRTSGCTWTSAANGANASTGGAKHPSPDEVHALVPRNQESNPLTPGWSIPDVNLAMARLGVGFEDRSGGGWGGVIHALDVERLYVILQGDSDVFENGTCAGAFDGDHAIGLHPHRNSVGQQRDDDPICLAVRYAGRSILQRYAEKLAPSVHFGVFTVPVPFVEVPHVVLDAPTPRELNAMITYANDVTSSRRLELERGQPLFRYPGGPRVTAMSTRAKLVFIGAAGPGWSAVKVRTGVPYRDKVSRDTVLYVPRKAGVLSEV